ncbi:uncharacterized protein DFL_001253 [Arthrobotrys flagrans]|uniref:Uncharacterized protein n=1 Tax=Arthrobotrys flagrans TaxID=97331 RepID=A0A437AGT5_ARTFL|nr:hypothetical protein DFL_001253 [Arthrobotrys flagrans]
MAASPLYRGSRIHRRRLPQNQQASRGTSCSRHFPIRFPLDTSFQRLYLIGALFTLIYYPTNIYGFVQFCLSPMPPSTPTGGIQSTNSQTTHTSNTNGGSKS